MVTESMTPCLFGLEGKQKHLRYGTSSSVWGGDVLGNVLAGESDDDMVASLSLQKDQQDTNNYGDLIHTNINGFYKRQNKHPT